MLKSVKVPTEGPSGGLLRDCDSRTFVASSNTGGGAAARGAETAASH